MKFRWQVRGGLSRFFPHLLLTRQTAQLSRGDVRYLPERHTEQGTNQNALNARVQQHFRPVLGKSVRPTKP